MKLNRILELSTFIIIYKNIMSKAQVPTRHSVDQICEQILIEFKIYVLLYTHHQARYICLLME